MQFYLASNLRTLILTWYFSRRYKNNPLLVDDACRPARTKEINEWLTATKRLMLWMGRIQPTNPIERYLMGILISDLIRQIDVAILLSKNVDLKGMTKDERK